MLSQRSLKVLNADTDKTFMSLRATGRRWLRMAVDYLPKGQSLPEDVWRVRHRTLTYLLRAHVVGIFIYSLILGNGLAHSITEAGIIAVFAALATTDGRYRRLSSAMAAVGLVSSSAVVVHLSGGIIEMHFHFFVMVGILTLYQDWLPFLMAIGFVVVHHAVLGTVQPHLVYNHPDAVAAPLKWAFIHGGFVLAASVASIVAWRLNEEQALRDSLTRLPNRALFQDRVGHALMRVQRRPRAIAVLFVDLDGFKDVNDSLGHAAGDHLLITVADRLRSALRTVDTPARLGGDEFAVLVEDIEDETQALEVGRRILDAFAVPFSVRGKQLTVGASIGIALNTPLISVETMLRNADVAMYTAKASGRGHCEIFRDAMHAAVVQRVEREAELHRASIDDDFVVCYQPIIALGTGRVAGVEALVRWQHPERGLLHAGQFMELAEKTGTICAIGAWVLDEACRQAVAWTRTHPHHPLTMSVNLSPAQLSDPNIVLDIQATISRHGLAATDLILELSEGILIGDSPLVVERLHALKALGVQLAVDDFGTGYSSLSYLRRMPYDILKIDKYFVDSIADGPAEEAFARSIIELAATLRLITVAEGVENAEQLDRLRRLGCELAQGHYFAEPLMPVDIVALLDESTASEAVDRTPLP